MKSATTALERLAIGVASLVLSVGLIALLSGFFAARDAAGVGGGSVVGGVQYPDQGHAHLAAGELRPEYNSEPPTSGAHIPLAGAARRDRAEQRSAARGARAGGCRDRLWRPPARPRRSSRWPGRWPGPFSPRLAAAGQAVILDARAGTAGLIALAWTRMLNVPSAADPRLRAFAGQWLGRGAR